MDHVFFDWIEEGAESVPSLRASRDACGLWSPLRDHAERGAKPMRPMRWKAMGLAVDVEFFKGDDEIGYGYDKDERLVEYRDFDVVFKDAANGSLLGVAEMVLMKVAEGAFASDCIAQLDCASGHAVDLGQDLLDLFGEFEDVFDGAPRVGSFDRIETHPSAPRGLGVELGRRLMAWFEKRHGVDLFILQPKPLQYGQSAPGFANPAGAAVDKAGFERGVARLGALYASQWGASALGEGKMAASGAWEFSWDKKSKIWKPSPKGMGK